MLTSDGIRFLSVRGYRKLLSNFLTKYSIVVDCATAIVLLFFDFMPSLTRMMLFLTKLCRMFEKYFHENVVSILLEIFRLEEPVHAVLVSEKV